MGKAEQYPPSLAANGRQAAKIDDGCVHVHEVAPKPVERLLREVPLILMVELSHKADDVCPLLRNVVAVHLERRLLLFSLDGNVSAKKGPRPQIEYMWYDDDENRQQSDTFWFECFSWIVLDEDLNINARIAGTPTGHVRLKHETQTNISDVVHDARFQAGVSDLQRVYPFYGYLVQRYDDGKLRPADGTPEWRTYTYWLHYSEGTFMPLMIVSLILGRIENARMPFFVKPIAKGITGKVRTGYLDANVARNLDFMEHTLGESKWFCGDRLTAADVQMSFALEAAEVRTNLSADYPHLAGFLQAVRNRPAYKAALDRGGHYELMGA